MDKNNCPNTLKLEAVQRSNSEISETYESEYSYELYTPISSATISLSPTPSNTPIDESEVSDYEFETLLEQTTPTTRQRSFSNTEKPMGNERPIHRSTSTILPQNEVERSSEVAITGEIINIVPNAYSKTRKLNTNSRSSR